MDSTCADDAHGDSIAPGGRPISPRLGRGIWTAGHSDADSASPDGAAPRPPDLGDEGDAEELEDIFDRLLPVLGWLAVMGLVVAALLVHVLMTAVL